MVELSTLSLAEPEMLRSSMLLDPVLVLPLMVSTGAVERPDNSVILGLDETMVFDDVTVSGVGASVGATFVELLAVLEVVED